MRACLIRQRRNEAVEEITAAWGKEQTSSARSSACLTAIAAKSCAKFRSPTGVERREIVETLGANACFLLETLQIAGDVQTQLLHLGIYDAAVFRAQLTLAGRFAIPELSELKIAPEDVNCRMTLAGAGG